MERSHFFLVDDRIEKAEKGGMNSMLLHVGDTMDPNKVKVPKTPYYWVDPPPNTSKRGDTFEKVDNPF